MPRNKVTIMPKEAGNQNSKNLVAIGYFSLIQQTYFCCVVHKNIFGDAVSRPPRLLRPGATAPP